MCNSKRGGKAVRKFSSTFSSSGDAGFKAAMGGHPVRLLKKK